MCFLDFISEGPDPAGMYDLSSYAYNMISTYSIKTGQIPDVLVVGKTDYEKYFNSPWFKEKEYGGNMEIPIYEISLKVVIAESINEGEFFLSNSQLNKI